MKYENAGDILPEALLQEIQKYAAGKLLYIPSGEYKRGWGESSGYRNQLLKRNQMIRNKYAHGLTVSELADEYYLSLDSIKKILYSKKNEKQLRYAPTIYSAVEYTQVGMLEEWLQCYSLFERENTTHSILLEGQLLFGVIKFPLRLIELASVNIPSLQVFTNETLDWYKYEPLLVYYEDGKFYCTIQEQLLIELKQRKINVYPSIIMMKSGADYKRFMKWFGNIFIYVNNV